MSVASGSTLKFGTRVERNSHPGPAYSTHSQRLYSFCRTINTASVSTNPVNAAGLGSKSKRWSSSSTLRRSLESVPDFLHWLLHREMGLFDNTIYGVLTYVRMVQEYGMNA